MIHILTFIANAEVWFRPNHARRNPGQSAPTFIYLLQASCIYGLPAFHCSVLSVTECVCLQNAGPGRLRDMDVHK